MKHFSQGDRGRSRRRGCRPRRDRGDRGGEARQHPGVRPDARHEDVGPLGAVRQAVPGEGLQGRRGLGACRQRPGRPAEAEVAGRPVHRRRREGPDHRPDRLRLRGRDRAGSPVEGRQVDRLRPPGRGRHGRPVRVVRRPPGRRAPGQGRRRRPEGEPASTRTNPVVASLWGGEEDANSFLFKGGVDQVLNPLYAQGRPQARARSSSCPGWDNQKAGTIFEQMLVKTSNKIDAVAAANDGLAERGRGRAEVAQAEADPAERPGRDDAGRPEHHLGLADDDGVEGRTHPRDQPPPAAIKIIKGQTPPTTGKVNDEGPRARAGLPDPAAVDHEGELAAAHHGAART